MSLTWIRMVLGGAVCGSFLGIFTGGLLGTLIGAFLGDVSFGLDGALIGGGVGCVGGILLSASLASRMVALKSSNSAPVPPSIREAREPQSPFDPDHPPDSPAPKTRLLRSETLTENDANKTVRLNTPGITQEI